MKLRFFYKTDSNRQPIPGSNIRRKSKPTGAKWIEMKNPCCDPMEVPCTCGPRFFVQLDGKGDPVDGTLIKRKKYPESSQSVRYMEVQWQSVCCPSLEFDFSIENGAPSIFTITVEGEEVINTTTGLSGVVIPEDGDLIQISMTNNGTSPINSLIAEGGYEQSLSLTPTSLLTWAWNASAGRVSVVGLTNNVPPVIL